MAQKKTGSNGKPKPKRKTKKQAEKDKDALLSKPEQPATDAPSGGAPPPTDPDTQAGGTPGGSFQPSPEPAVEDPAGGQDEVFVRLAQAIHQLQTALRGASLVGAQLALSRNPATEAKVRGILMGGASTALMFAMLTKTPDDDRIAAFILQKVQDQTSWNEWAQAIFGPVEATRSNGDHPLGQNAKAGTDDADTTEE